jgi:hypothetical protein
MTLSCLIFNDNRYSRIETLEFDFLDALFGLDSVTYAKKASSSITY